MAQQRGLVDRPAQGAGAIPLEDEGLGVDRERPCLAARAGRETSEVGDLAAEFVGELGPKRVGAVRHDGTSAPIGRPSTI